MRRCSRLSRKYKFVKIQLESCVYLYQALRQVSTIITLGVHVLRIDGSAEDVIYDVKRPLHKRYTKKDMWHSWAEYLK